MNRLIFVFFLLFAGLWGRPVRAVEHGVDQLQRFVEARPGTAPLLKEDSEYRRFLIQAFAGAYTSVPLRWDRKEPQGNAYAENTPNDDRTFILIRVSSKLNAHDQVAALVYECMNAQNEEAFGQYIEDAYLGNLTKTQFIHRILRLEHLKLKQVRAFLAHLHPFTELDPSGTEFYRKMLHTPEEFDDFLEYLREIKRDDYDVFDMYSKFYDFITATPEIRKAQLDRQRARAAREREEKEAAQKKKKQGDLPPVKVPGEQIF